MRLRLPACAWLLTALLLCPAVANAAAYKVLNLPSLGCSLELPAAWVGHKKGKALVYSGAKGTDEYRTTISLQVVNQRAYPSLQAVAADYIKQWKSGGRFQLLTQQSGTVGGRQSVLLAARYTYQGRTFHQEQIIISRPPYYYLLGYTSPEEIRSLGKPHILHAVKTFRFLPLPAPGSAVAKAPTPAAARLRQEQASVAAYGPALLKQLEGPLYSHAFNNGTPQGREVASAHNLIVAELAKTLAAQATAQKPALEWLAKLGDLQLKQMALLEQAKGKSPATAAWWAKAKALLKQQMDYTVVRTTQRGAVEGALIGQAKPAEASLSLAGVQMLAKLQLAVSDQLALLLQENDRLWAPSLKLWEAVSADPALPASFRLQLAQLNQEQRELALGLTRATIEANGAMAATVLVIGNLEGFYDEVSRTYGAAIAAALPRLRRDARRLAAARPGDPAVASLEFIIANLEKTAEQARLAAGPAPRPPLGRRIADALVPPAQAGAWQFTKDFVYNAGYSVAIAGKAVQNAGRFIASGVETSSQRAAQVLAYGTYSPFKVTSDPKAILATADEIIKKNPEMAKHRAVLEQRLGRIATRHQSENAQDYLKLKKQTVDAAVKEYATGQYGVRALKTGVQYIDDVSNMKVKPAAAWVAGKVSKEVLGHEIGGAVSPATKGMASWFAGSAYNVVADLPKNTMILLNPSTSYAEKATATYGLAGNVGVTVLCYGGTAAAVAGKAARAGKGVAGWVAGKVAPAAAAAKEALLKKGSQLVSRMLPAGAKAAAQATAQMVKPVAAQVSKQVAREAAALMPLEAQAANYMATALKVGVNRLKDMSAKPVLATLGTETKAMLSTAWRNLTKEMVSQKTIPEALKAFAGNFAFKEVLQSGANDSFQAEVMQPTLQAVEDHAPPAWQTAQKGWAGPGPQPGGPFPGKVERSFDNQNLLKADQGKNDGFSAKAATSAKDEDKKAEAKPKPVAKKKAKPRKETAEERRARKKALMDKAKRLAARDESVYGKQESDATQVIPSTCTIDMITWTEGHAKDKWPTTFYVRGGQVSATLDSTYNYQKHCTDKFCCSNPRTTGVFSGTLMNNVISGDWKMKHHTQQCWHIWTESIKGGDGKYTRHQRRCNYSTTSETTFHIETKLGMNGRVEATYSGTSHGSTTWGPTCYKSVAGTTKTYSNSFRWDDPKYPEEYRNKLTIGVWEIRKRPEAEEKQE
ncbi:MAG: DUF1795 domain-containing protein [Desulfarculaceae bacterium]|nr:DUF1795 domain-containing protein [Desulfarculaceae bacterium]